MPGIAEAFSTALRLHNSGDLANAERIYREILSVDPNHADSIHLLGVIAFHAGRPDVARQLIQHAVALNPAAPEYYSNLGNVLKEAGTLEEAIGCYQRAISLRPEFADAHYNLGNAFLQGDRLEEAVAAYRESIRIRPDFLPVCVNIGNALRSLGRVREAIGFYDKVHEGAADFAEARWNRAIALLLSGELAEGWDAYECRWNLERAKPRLRNFTQPAWDGSNAAGRRILLHAEQGFGDTIQFIRYAPMVAALGARVIVECQPELTKVASRIDGMVQVVPAGDALPEFDAHLPLLALPRIFRTTLKSVPSQVPYLSADPALARQWTSRLPRRKGVLKVGLVWAGGTSDPKRDCSLAQLAALADAAPGAAFVSLQKGGAAAQAASPPAHMTLLDVGGRLSEFADTAAVISKLDLVISIDTSVLHLAGALGKPAWALLRYAPDWRWLLGRADSPWYPTMRLFRQTVPGAWQEPIGEMARALAQLRKGDR